MATRKSNRPRVEWQCFEGVLGTAGVNLLISIWRRERCLKSSNSPRGRLCFFGLSPPKKKAGVVEPYGGARPRRLTQ